MKILICLSNVPDTTTKIKLGGDRNFDKTGVQWIINPWDELALTRALELKDDPGSPVDRVTVITVGGKDAEPTIRKALAIGADDAVRIDAEPEDAFVTASQIAEVVKKDMYDIIICGIESSDYNGSTVGGMVAELLEIPSVSAVSALSVGNDGISVNREIDGGKEIISVTSPVLVVVQKGIAKEPRIASMRGIMMAKSKPLNVITAAQIESLTEYPGLELPVPRAACKMISPDNVKELVELLRNEAKVI